MRPFEYIRCDSVDGVCSLLASKPDKTRILAGGTDLLLELRRNSASHPAVVADISSIQSLRGISGVAGEIHIGPLTTHAEIARSPVIRSGAAFLADAARAIGSPQIRNRGTIGGNIMNAAACADTVPPLIALSARLTLSSVRGSRVVEIEQFFAKPYQTVAAADEILTQITFPAIPQTATTAFVKLGRRNALSIARLSVAVLIARDSRRIITEARIVPGAAFPTWRRIAGAEQLLTGKQPSRALFTEAGAMTSSDMVEVTGRRWSTEYKEPVLATLVRRALERCCPVGQD